MPLSGGRREMQSGCNSPNPASFFPFAPRGASQVRLVIRLSAGQFVCQGPASPASSQKRRFGHNSWTKAEHDAGPRRSLLEQSLQNE